MREIRLAEITPGRRWSMQSHILCCSRHYTENGWQLWLKMKNPWKLLTGNTFSKRNFSGMAWRLPSAVRKVIGMNRSWKSPKAEVSRVSCFGTKFFDNDATHITSLVHLCPLQNTVVKLHKTHHHSPKHNAMLFLFFQQNLTLSLS